MLGYMSGSGGKSGERRKAVAAKKQAGEKIVLVLRQDMHQLSLIK